MQTGRAMYSPHEVAISCIMAMITLVDIVTRLCDSWTRPADVKQHQQQQQARGPIQPLHEYQEQQPAHTASGGSEFYADVDGEQCECRVYTRPWFSILLFLAFGIMRLSAGLIHMFSFRNVKYSFGVYAWTMSLYFVSTWIYSYFSRIQVRNTFGAGSIFGCLMIIAQVALAILYATQAQMASMALEIVAIVFVVVMTALQIFKFFAKARQVKRN